MMPDLKDAERLSRFRDAGETRERVCDAVRGALHSDYQIVDRSLSHVGRVSSPARSRVAPFYPRKKKTFGPFLTSGALCYGK